ncbi:MAG: class A beta-lactamase [Acidobacteria bacterium]|nr:class A beta-lactamase [Acidobacteriota bacterium]
MILALVLAVTLPQEFLRVAAGMDGRVGICAVEVGQRPVVCVRGSERFSLQSVMKLVVAAAVFDAVDRHVIALTDVVVVQPGDASPGPQAFANRVRAQGSLPVTVEQLVRLAVNDSDSTAVDVLIARLGGVGEIQGFLRRRQIEHLRIDRDERTLQAETSGMHWRPELADEQRFDQAAKAVPAVERDAAWTAYLTDVRDTVTPEGMVGFLSRLAQGELLSADSTQQLLSILEDSRTGLDRLRAGTPPAWRLGNKTGTSGAWRGMTATTNDVGLMTLPDGRRIAVAVFVAESRRSNAERAAAIAAVARLVAAAHQTRQE